LGKLLRKLNRAKAKAEGKAKAAATAATPNVGEAAPSPDSAAVQETPTSGDGSLSADLAKAESVNTQEMILRAIAGFASKAKQKLAAEEHAAVGDVQRDRHKCFVYFDNCRSIRFADQSYTLPPNAANVVRKLHEAYKRISPM
jgi:hypothetical protein